MDAIDRSRTAQHRADLSAPVRHLLRLGLLDEGVSFFDYGCGRGDDVRRLRALGIDAAGWDPAFEPDAPRAEADVVNLGFVLNVIERPGERAEALRSAFRLARKVLAVSVMLGYRAHEERFARHGDGVRTQRNTFQKYYTQEEFRGYVEAILETGVVSFGPGMCLVFRDAIDEQLFLLQRQQVRREWRLLRKTPDSAALAEAAAEHRARIDAYWRRTLELGRAPAEEECAETLPLSRLVGSRRRLHDWVAGLFDAEEFESAAVARQEDLLVYFALANFGRRRPYTRLPPRLQRDVRHFFGRIGHAERAGKRALLAIADRQRVAEAVAFCHGELGIGRMGEGGEWTLHQSVLGFSLPLVRIYVGCAMTLFGDVELIDLVQLRVEDRQVAFLRYDDFDGTAPKLVERAVVDLARQRVRFTSFVGRREAPGLEGVGEEYYLG